jgi:hypothetical protein
VGRIVAAQISIPEGVKTSFELEISPVRADVRPGSNASL